MSRKGRKGNKHTLALRGLLEPKPVVISRPRAERYGQHPLADTLRENDEASTAYGSVFASPLVSAMNHLIDSAISKADRPGLYEELDVEDLVVLIGLTVAEWEALAMTAQMDQEHVAELLGISQQAVSKRVASARRKIWNSLLTEGDRDRLSSFCG